MFWYEGKYELNFKLCLFYQLNGMYHKFILFYFAISQFDWPIARKNSENYFGSFMYKDLLPPLWFKYIHEKVRTLGKSLWYKIQDC
jgi:hypothetical protein